MFSRYGLLLPKKGQNKVQIKSVFGDDSDDENAHDAINTSLQKMAQQSKIKRQTQLEIDKALEADPTVYEYDSIYDTMQEKKAQQVSATSSKSKVDRKPKYIAGLLKASEVRKREYERQQERIVQKEREKEGDEFADKEVFVTSAYRKKMQEMQEAEEEEKRQAQIEAILDVKNQKDMTGFYRYLLNEKTGENVKAGDNVKTDDNVKTGENVKAGNNVKTEVDKPSEIVIAEEEKSKEKISNKDNTDSQQDEAISIIKKEPRENKERRQYRPRQSSSSSSGSRSDTSSNDDDDQISNEAEKRLRSKEEDGLLKKDRGRSDSKPENIKEMSLKTRNNDKSDIKGQKRKQMSRSSSSSSDSDDEKTKTSKKNKSEDKEIKKETKLDKELTIEEIKARYARRTTKEMVEDARQRYFLRKIERDQTKPYIFRSDE